MRAARPEIVCIALTSIALVACEGTAKLTIPDGTGPTPRLPPPSTGLIPAVKIATATGWPAGAKPTPATGLSVAALATGLDHPRWLYVLPNGDVLVAETSAPAKPGANKGVKGWLMKRAMKKAGSAVPSANRITLLRDGDGDGQPEVRETFLAGLNSPFGMALVGKTFYVANSDAVLKFPYEDGVTRIAGPGSKLVDLPAGALNHHWTKNLIASADGARLYVTVGSNSNVAEHGLDKEQGRAAVWEVDTATGEHRLFATGLRNPNGLAWQPDTGALWTVVNERDELGGDLVPDYMTSLQRGAFYGWPYSYFGSHVDTRVRPRRPDLVALAVVPDYALGPHTASLGLAYSSGNALPSSFKRGMFVGQHGSWNRKPPSGYKVLFVPFRSDGQPAGPPIDVLSGFLSDRGEARGRPVGVALDKHGALLVADDVGNTVWRVTAVDN